jgi:hypothetical protein
MAEAPAAHGAYPRGTGPAEVEHLVAQARVYAPGPPAGRHAAGVSTRVRISMLWPSRSEKYTPRPPHR